MNWTVLLAIASIIGTIANVRKQRWCFLVWIVTNAGWCLHNLQIGEYAQGALSLVYFGLAVWGLWAWRSGREVI